MATRKCGNIYFPKYFMTVRPFLTRVFFKIYLGWRGQKVSLKKFVTCAILNPGFICSVCVPFLGS